MRKEINEMAHNTRTAYTGAARFFAKCIALDGMIVLGSAIVEAVTADRKGGEKTTEK